MEEIVEEIEKAPQEHVAQVVNRMKQSVDPTVKVRTQQFMEKLYDAIDVISKNRL